MGETTIYGWFDMGWFMVVYDGLIWDGNHLIMLNSRIPASQNCRVQKNKTSLALSEKAGLLQIHFFHHHFPLENRHFYWDTSPWRSPFLLGYPPVFRQSHNWNQQQDSYQAQCQLTEAKNQPWPLWVSGARTQVTGPVHNNVPGCWAWENITGHHYQTLSDIIR